MARIKRTYNLPDRTVRVVRELTDRYGAAPTQDAVVELAVDELLRAYTDAEEGAAWEAASKDPAWLAEVADHDRAFPQHDPADWPPE